MMTDRNLMTSSLRIAGLRGDPGAAHQPEIRLGRPGRCGPTPTLTIAIDDRSPSVWMYGGADPVGRRYLELARAFRHMARSCQCGECLAAAVSFDTPDGDLDPVRIASRLYRPAVARYFSAPSATAGRSELLPALGQVRALASIYPDHDVQLAILTDWELFEDFGVVRNELDNFDHTLAIGLNRPVPTWVEGPFTTTQELSYTDQPGTLALAMFRELTRGRVGTTERMHR